MDQTGKDTAFHVGRPKTKRSQKFGWGIIKQRHKLLSRTRDWYAVNDSFPDKTRRTVEHLALEAFLKHSPERRLRHLYLRTGSSGHYCRYCYGRNQAVYHCTVESQRHVSNERSRRENTNCSLCISPPWWNSWLQNPHKTSMGLCWVFCTRKIVLYNTGLIKKLIDCINSYISIMSDHMLKVLWQLWLVTFPQSSNFEDIGPIKASASNSASKLIV